MKYKFQEGGDIWEQIKAMAEEPTDDYQVDDEQEYVEPAIDESVNNDFTDEELFGIPEESYDESYSLNEFVNPDYINSPHDSMSVINMILNSDDSSPLKEKSGLEWLQTKDNSVNISNTSSKLAKYLNSLPIEIKKELLATSGNDSDVHSENSRHYKGEALDFRFNDKVYNYMVNDPLFKSMNLSIPNPNHGTAKHIHLEERAYGGDGNGRKFVDSVNTANKDKNFIQRMYGNNNPTPIHIEGQSGISTHMMESSDNIAYPTVVEGTDIQNVYQIPGQLNYLNQYNRDGAYNYAKRTGNYIRFNSDKDADWYANNGYKKGTGVLPKFEGGGDPHPGQLSRSDIERRLALEKSIKNQKTRNSQSTISQYTPKTGDQKRMNDNRYAFLSENEKPLNKLASNSHIQAAGKNLTDATEFAAEVASVAGMATGVGSIGVNALRLGAGALNKAIGRNAISRAARSFTSNITPYINTIDDIAAYVQGDAVGIIGNSLNKKMYNPSVALNTANNTLTGVKRNLTNSGIEATDLALGNNSVGSYNNILSEPKIISRGPENPTGIRMHDVGYQSPATGDLAPRLTERPVDSEAQKVWESFFRNRNNAGQLPERYVTPTNIYRNLEDLQYAKQKFGSKYKIPDDIERIAKSDELTNRTIRGLVNRDNTFVRGVSTNWNELEKRNPEILRHLEGKGFDLSTEDGSRKAAEYMGTHVPINTTYGRASLNDIVFKRGMDGLYTSNSISTAEGYTYGQGYIVKGKKPTNFSSSNRKDWIDNNSLDYYEHNLPRNISVEDLKDNINSWSNKSHPVESWKDFFNSHSIGENNVSNVNSWIDDIKKQKLELRKKYNLAQESEGDYAIDHIVGRRLKDDEYSLPEIDNIHKSQVKNVNNYRNDLNEYINTKKQELFSKLEPIAEKDLNKRLLKTEHSSALPYSDFRIGDNSFKIKQIHEELLPKLKLSAHETNFLKEALIHFTEEYRKEGFHSSQIAEKLKTFLKDNYSTVDKYAHYIHIGTPGEKILESLSSKKITPDIWKNKSRAHTNTYSKGFSSASVLPLGLGTAATTLSLDKKQTGGYSTKYIINK